MTKRNQSSNIARTIEKDLKGNPIIWSIKIRLFLETLL